jgi:hypothetical protein
MSTLRVALVSLLLPVAGVAACGGSNGSVGQSGSCIEPAVGVACTSSETACQPSDPCCVGYEWGCTAGTWQKTALACAPLMNGSCSQDAGQDVAQDAGQDVGPDACNFPADSGFRCGGPCFSPGLQCGGTGGDPFGEFCVAQPDGGATWECSGG